jgi:hypothetical protein
MFNVKRVSTLNLLAGALALGLTTACHHQAADTAATPPTEADMVNKMEVNQTAAGAKSDATLNRQHFDAGTLTSLGTDKLDLMLADSHKQAPLVVYLDIPDDSYKSARATAVTQYLTGHGLQASQIQVVAGANPDNFHPADPDLSSYIRTDTAGDISGGGTSSASPGH